MIHYVYSYFSLYNHCQGYDIWPYLSVIGFNTCKLVLNINVKIKKAAFTVTKHLPDCCCYSYPQDSLEVNF